EIALVTREGEIPTQGARYDKAPVFWLEDQSEGLGIIPDLRDDAAPGAENRVESPVRCVAGQGEARVAADAVPAGGDEFPVGLDDEGRGRGVVTGEVGDRPAAGAEGGIQATVRVVAGEREVGGRDSRRDELAVGLQGQGEGDIDTAEIGERKRAVAGVGADEDGAEVGDDLARVAEGGVQRTIRVVADESEIEIEAARSSGRSRGDQPAVRLDDEREGLIIPAIRAEISDNPPAAAEGGVQRSITLVPREREVHGPG